MEKINKCRVCDNKDIKEFFDLGDQPPANSLLMKEDDKENFYPLVLDWCQECNLVQLNYTVDSKELFSYYVWVTGTSPTTQRHAKTFYENVMKRISSDDLNDSYVLELASNDGTFLKPFISNGYKVLGVDPAENIAAVANKEGITTKCAFFGKDTAKEIIEDKGKSKVVIARNVLPHVANLHDFTEGLSISVENDGFMIVEFHYAKIIQEDLHYDSIYHEHVCYYTIKSIEKLLNKYGLYLHDIEQSPINAGNIILYTKKGKCDEKSSVIEYRKNELENKTNELSSWEKFAETSYKHKDELLKMLNDSISNNENVVGYGSSARSSTMLNFCNLGTDYVSMIADQNPLKQDKFTAGTHIPIYEPGKVMEAKPDTVFILAWNFADEIISGLKENFDFKGKIILPLPDKPTIKNID